MTALATASKKLIAKEGTSLTLTRSTPGAYDKSTGTVSTTPTNQTIQAAITQYRSFEVDGSQVIRNDRKILVSPQDPSGVALVIVPKAGDSINDGTNTYQVVEVQEIASRGTVAVYVCQGRK